MRNTFVNPIGQQRGAASAITVVILLVLIAGMVIASLQMSSSSISSSHQQTEYTRALFLMESALERLTYTLNNDGAAVGDCTGIASPDTQTLGSGSFEMVTITPDAVNNPDIDCTFKLKATVNNTVRFGTFRIFNDGTSSVGTGADDFLEPFPSNADYNADWTWVTTGTKEGNENWDATNCPGGTCPTATGGTFYVETVTGGGGGNRRDMNGYIEKNLPSPFTTPAGGLNVTITGGWRKLSSSGTNPNRQNLSIHLVDTGGVESTIYSDNSKSGNSPWTAFNANFVLPGSTSFNRIRIEVDFIGRRTGAGGGTWHHPQMYLDEIEITGISGGGASWHIVDWAESDI